MTHIDSVRETLTLKDGDSEREIETQTLRQTERRPQGYREGGRWREGEREGEV